MADEPATENLRIFFQTSSNFSENRRKPTNYEQKQVFCLQKLLNICKDNQPSSLLIIPPIHFDETNKNGKRFIFRLLANKHWSGIWRIVQVWIWSNRLERVWKWNTIDIIYINCLNESRVEVKNEATANIKVLTFAFLLQTMSAFSVKDCLKAI